MTVLFAGTEPDAFNYPSAPSFETGGGRYDGTFVRGALRPNGNVSSPDWTPVKSTWLHFDHCVYQNNSLNADLGLEAADGTPLVRVIFNTGDATGTMIYWNGTTWVGLGKVPISNSSLLTYDIHYRNTATGRIAFYVGSSLIAQATGDFSALKDAARFRANNNNNFWMALSQVVVADEPTLGFKLAYRQPTGAGVHTAWAGTFAEVNAQIPTDTVNISSNTADQRESFTKALFTVPNGMEVKTVGATARTRRGETGPQKISMSLRFGSTDYDSPAKDVGVDMRPIQAFWDVNPATGLKWVNVDAGSITVEFGVKAVA